MQFFGLEYKYVIEKDYLHEYMKCKIPYFNNLLVDIERVSDYLENVFVLEDCKDIDNIQKIEQSFIRGGIDNDLDNKNSCRLINVKLPKWWC